MPLNGVENYNPAFFRKYPKAVVEIAGIDRGENISAN
jgi:hypothetical protein